MSTFGTDSARRLRALDPAAAAYLAAELRNLATPIHCHLVAPGSDSAADAADSLQALLTLADRLDAGVTLAEDVAHIRRDPDGTLEAMAKRGVW